MHTTTTPVERRARLLEAAAQVGRAVTSILEPDRLLQHTVDIICDAYGFYYAAVFLLDESGEWAVLRAGRGEAGRRMLSQGHRLQVGGNSMIGAAMGRREARIALDVGQEAVRFDNPLLPLTRSEMALPLVVGDTVIGALGVQSVEEAAFSPDDITSLQAMADQLAIAIHNARLHGQVQHLLSAAERRTRLLEAAAEVGRDVTSILDLDTLLKRTVDIICDAYGFYYAAVFLLDESGEWAVLRAGRGEAGRRMLSQGHRLQVGGNSMIGAATGRREARIALDVGQEAVRFDNPLLPLTRSEMALPLVEGDTVIGALGVQSVEEAAFSPDDITSLQAMADQLAVAIDNARLLRDLEAAHRELVRTKTFEAVARATSEAIHWIGNKASPIPGSVGRVRADLLQLRDVPFPADLRAARQADTDEPPTGYAAAWPFDLDSMLEDLDMVDHSARLILAVRENLIGPAREVKPHPVLLQDTLKDAVVALGVPAEIVEYRVAENVPPALADSAQMSRALAHLIRNALEALEGVDQPRLQIGVQPVDEGRAVEVTITDNGAGIPPAELEQVWVPFYTTRDIHSHLGLGLPAARLVVEQAEGRIALDSRPGSGTTVTLRVPAAEVSNLSPAPCYARVLLVDDDENDAWAPFAAFALHSAGCGITRAPAQPDYGLPTLPPANDLDLILVDDVLAQADTLALLEQIAAARPGVPLVVVSSRLDVERSKQAMQAGASDVWPKHGALHDLLAAVRGVLE